MLSALSRVFRRNNAGQSLGLPVEHDDIPRYPPFAKGFPVVSVARIMASQDELISRIYYSTGVSQADFDRLYIPVIVQYAGFVHLLPASELHHHRGGGGLFRHGLEVAFLASQGSREIVFTREGTPQERRHDKEVWQFAATMAGLAHDAGKPLTDLAITDRAGEKLWDRVTRLSDWLSDNSIDRYFIHWKESRHRNHLKENGFGLADILTPDARRYIKSASTPVMGAIQDAIHGTDMTRPLTRLVVHCDTESVRQDMRSNHINPDEHTYGVPVDSYILDAIRRLVRNRTWRVNEVGGKVWHLEQGLFIVWHGAVDDIVALLEADQTPGVPRDPASMADVLIERGRAQPRIIHPEEASGQGDAIQQPERFYRYWQVTPKMLVTGDPDNAPSLLMLKLVSPELIFAWEPPPPIRGVVVGDSTEPDSDAKTDSDQQDSVSQEHAENTVVPMHPAMPEDRFGQTDTTVQPQTASDTADAMLLPMTDAPEDELDDDPLRELAAAGGALGQGLEPSCPFDSADMPGTSSGGATITNETDSQPTPDNAATAEQQTPPPALTPAPAATEAAPALTEQSRYDPEIEPTTQQPEIREQAGVSAEAVNEPTEQHALFENAGLAREILIEAVQPIRDGSAVLGEHIALVKGRIVMFYPDGAKNFGEPKVIAKTLHEAGVIETDPIHPGKRVQRIGGYTALIFTAGFSRAIREYLSDAEQVRETALASAGTASRSGTGSALTDGVPAPVACDGNTSSGEVQQKQQPVKTPAAKKVQPVAAEVQPKQPPVKAPVAKKVQPIPAEVKPKQPPAKKPAVKTKASKAVRRVEKRQAKSEMTPIGELPQTRQIRHQRPDRPLPRPTKLNGIIKPAASICLRGDDKAPPKETVEIVNSDSARTMTPELLLLQIREQILEGQGRWIVSGVRKTKDKLVTCDKVIDKSLAEHTHISKRDIHDACVIKRTTYRMMIRGGSVYVDIN